MDEVSAQCIPCLCVDVDDLCSMENFISGYPGCEFQIREALADVVGVEKRDLFFDKVCVPGNRIMKLGAEIYAGSFWSTSSSMPTQRSSRASV